MHCCRPWSKDSWINFLKDKHGKLEDHFERKPAQPNPWRAEGVDTTSKRYYINLMQVFEGTSASSPTRIVEDACRKVVEFMGGDDVAKFRQGHDLHYMYIYIDTYSGVYRYTIRRPTTRQCVCSAVCALR